MPVTGIKERVRRFVLDELSSGPLRDDESFWENRAVDSIGIIRLIHFLESEFGLDVPGRDVTSKTFASIDEVSGYVARRLEERSEPR